MKVLHWNTSRISSPMSGIKKYEDELYASIIRIIQREGLEIDIQRILRGKNIISGSTVISWFTRYRCHGADLIHATSQVIAPTRYIKKPRQFIVTVHDLAPLVYPFEIKDISEKIQWIFTPKALKMADKIIAISEFTKKELISLIGIDEEKIEVIYQGVSSFYKPMRKDICRKFFNLDPDKKYLLYVASDLPHKRCDLIKEILKKVKKCRDDVLMIKAGYSKKLLDESIINIGWVREKNMPKLYNCADVYVHTSEYEGFGLPVLEALACGLYVVAFKKAAIPEVVGKAGSLVDCIDDFVEQILKNLERKTPNKKGIERSKKFNWNNTAKKTLEVYGIK